MSAECTGWVYRHSPAKGATLLVHLALADSANDQHAYELWMRQAQLAAKARVSRRAAGEALQWLVDHGLLQLLEHGKARGSANRYRFLMPEAEPVWVPAALAGIVQPGGTGYLPTPMEDGEGAQPLRTVGAQPGGMGAQPGGTTVRSQVAHNPSATQPEPNPTPTRAEALPGLSDADLFDRFWRAYPRKTDKGAARKAWARAVRKADPEVVIAGAERYAADPNRDDAYTKHASTWLNAEAWDNPPLPAKRAGQRAQPKLDTDRDAEAGRLYL